MKMFNLKAGIIISIFFVSVRSSEQLNQLIQFPLKNIKNSINTESNTTFESSFKSEFKQYYDSKKYALNLPRLNLRWTPNPYPGFIESEHVVAINLQENGIYRILPGSFDSVPNLQYLDLSKNRLAFCDIFDYGSCLQNLITLVIEENHLPGDSLYREISKAGCFPKLQHLYIRKNHIRRLNFPLAQYFPNLVSLYLSDNEIDTCAFIRNAPSSLDHLYVERNYIYSISSAVTKNLKTLVANGNIIKSICYKNCDDTSLKLLGTTRLEVLSLAENKITKIESCAFLDSYSLMSLNLSSNSIETINPSTFASLRVLTQLYLDNNFLTRMPNLSGNWYLKTLSLSNNRITEIKREFFSHTTTLQRLLLGGNIIKNINCNAFDDLIWLQELNLSNNELKSLPAEWMSKLTNLRYLDLKSNRFMHVYQLSLSYSLSLKTIYLQNNQLSQSDKNTISMYCPYSQVYIENKQTSLQDKYNYSHTFY